jgi:hypothetical protein
MTGARFTDAELDELLGAYALDAVDPDEQLAVEDYLRINPRARAEVAEHREVAAQLAFEGSEAPTHLWSAIEGALDEAPPELTWLPSLRDAADASRPTGQPEANGSEAPLAPVVPIRKGPLRAGVALAVATAAAILIAAGFAVALGQNDTPSSAERAIAAVDDDPDALTGSLVAEDGGLTAEAGLSTDGVGYIDGSDLPTLDEGRTYQLWGVSGDLVISLGVLGPEPEVWVFEAAETVDALALTDEAAPGVVSSSQPTVVVGELA